MPTHLSPTVALDTGDEVAGELDRFVKENEAEGAFVTAIGAFRDALLGYFGWPAKRSKKIIVDEQVEVLSLIGDVTVADEGRRCISMPFWAELMAALSAAISRSSCPPDVRGDPGVAAELFTQVPRCHEGFAADQRG